MFAALPRKYKHKSKRKNRSAIVRSYWHWRRVVSLIVLITFSSSMFSSAFASNHPLGTSETRMQEVGAKTKKVKQQEVWLRNLMPVFVQSEANKKFNQQFKQSQNQLFSPQNKYQPYLEIGGAKYFNQVANASGVCDLFIPLLQRADQLLFADLRIFGRSSGSSEGNLHLGYRKLYPATKKLFGIYGAFDHKKSIVGGAFNQLTLGFEYWQDRWFIGVNAYKPIGKTTAYKEIILKPESEKIESFIITKTITNKYYERALPGVDAELGFAITDKLMSRVNYLCRLATITVAGWLAPLPHLKSNS